MAGFTIRISAIRDRKLKLGRKNEDKYRMVHAAA
jgi:hypothetical protein